MWRGPRSPHRGPHCPWGLMALAAWLHREGWGESSLPAFAPSRATLDPLALLVLLEKMVPKVFEETLAPLAELVTLVSKVLLAPLVKRENLEMMGPQ